MVIATSLEALVQIETCHTDWSLVLDSPSFQDLGPRTLIVAVHRERSLPISLRGLLLGSVFDWGKIPAFPLVYVTWQVMGVHTRIIGIF